MKKLVFLLLLFNGFLAFAQNEVIFDQATAAYNAGEYEKAATHYLTIVEKGEHSSELYFNLGNCYYKLNQIAPSIYYYEKALLLNPNDSEVLNNLGYAKNMSLDAIEILPETGISKIYKNATEFLSFDQWSYVTILFVLLFVIFYIAFFYFRYATKKRIAFIASAISIIIALISFVFAFLAYTDFKADQPAIIFANEATVKSEPNTRSQAIFKLHEGTKVNVLEELNEWKKIKIADGKTGWMPKEDLKMLKDN